MTDLECARTLLDEQQLTCAFVKGDWVYTSTGRGVKPLLNCLDQPQKRSRFAAADKVVGKAAAFLYVLLEAREVYAGVISKPALTVLEEAGIEVTYDCLVDAIRNRAGNGGCPMEMAVWNICDPQEALKAVLTKVKDVKIAGNEIKE